MIHRYSYACEKCAEKFQCSIDDAFGGDMLTPGQRAWDQAMTYGWNYAPGIGVVCWQHDPARKPRAWTSTSLPPISGPKPRSRCTSRAIIAVALIGTVLTLDAYGEKITRTLGFGALVVVTAAQQFGR